MELEINKSYDVSDFYEFSANFDEFCFLIIYGKHVNGWFIAVPNWQICVEASAPTSYSYNFDKLSCVVDSNFAEVISKAVMEHWKSLNN